MYRVGTLVLIAAALCTHAAADLAAQQNEGDQLLTDIRLFTVLTAINIVGYDNGLGSPSDSAVRRVG